MATVDGLTLHACVMEMQGLLIGGKVDKIIQPDHDEIHMIIRNGCKNYRVLISACPDSCRAGISSIKKPAQIEAPMFCMLLRKHLTGGRLVNIEQVNTDRLIKFEIESTDELYNTDRYFLVCELMGRCSNIILLNSSGKIMDACKKIGISENQLRPIIPNVTYTEPPTAKRADPLSCHTEDIENVLNQSGRIDKLLSSAFYGIAPIVISHLLSVLNITYERSEQLSESERHNLAQNIFSFFSNVKNGIINLCIVKIDDKEIFLPFLPNNSYEYKSFDSAGEMLDFYYIEKDKREYMRRRSSSLLHAVDLKLKRAEKKLAGFDQAISAEGDFDKYRVYGELLTANLYKIKPGQKEVTVENYYEQPMVTVTVPLDQALSPIKNAQKYFKIYKKARGAKDTAERMRTSVLAEIEYLYGIEDIINRSDSVQTLDEIRAELEENKYIRPEQGQKRKRAVKHNKPERYVSSDGYEILVGRNNYQNDELTFKIASANDIWLHVKDRPGSHTVIINPEHNQIPDTTLVEAATLAAKHSSANSGAKIEVDYTLCRYVKKPTGALPGKVIYTNQKTIIVIP